MIYRHPTDLRRTVERDGRDRELEYYGWTPEGQPAPEPAPVERKPRRRTAKPKAEAQPAPVEDGAGDDEE